jgi:phage/plasmid-like protein (TIGR03299 family)
MADYFESGVFNREAAWHRMGNVWQPSDKQKILTPGIAIKLGELDEWDLYKDPILRKGEETGRFWVVRGKDDTILGHSVGKGYEIITNEDGFKYLDQLVDSGDLEIETAISIYNGKVVTILARKPESMSIAGDSYDRYIGFTTRHDGLGASKVFTCYERVVCANTQSIAEAEFKKSKRSFSIRHQGDTDMKLVDAREALELSFEEDEAFAKELEKMAATSLEQDTYGTMLADIVGLRGIDKNKQERKYHNRVEIAATINKIRKTTEDLENIKNTRLGLFQATTAFDSHIRKYRNDSTKFQTLAVEGAEFTNRAFKTLVVS